MVWLLSQTMDAVNIGGGVLIHTANMNEGNAMKCILYCIRV